MFIEQQRIEGHGENKIQFILRQKSAKKITKKRLSEVLAEKFVKVTDWKKNV